MAIIRQAKKETKRTGTGGTVSSSKGAVVAPVKKTESTTVQYRSQFGKGQLYTAANMKIFQSQARAFTPGYFQIVPGTYGAPDYNNYEEQAPQATKTQATADPNLKDKLAKKRVSTGRNSTLLTQRVNTGTLASLLGKTAF